MWRSEHLWKAWRWVKPFATFLMLLAICLALLQYSARNWHLIASYNWRIDWPWLGVAILSMGGFFAFLAIGWQQVVIRSGTAIPWTKGLWIWSSSSLARYLPTPIWVTGSRIYLTVQLGSSWSSAALSFGAEVTGAVATALSLSLLALPIWVVISPTLPILAAGAVILLVLPLFYFLLQRLLHHFTFPLKCGLISLVGWSSLYAVAFILYGMVHIFVLQALATPIPPFNLVIGVSVFAWAVGTLNILSPSGLGTREITLVYGLQNYISPPELLALSAISRLVAVVGELLLFIASYALVTTRCSMQRVVTDAKAPFEKKP